MSRDNKRNERVAENGGYERLRLWTVQWAMVDQLRKPSKGFESAIRTHFRLKRRHIKKTTQEWLREARDESDTPGHYTALKAQCDELYPLLDSLGPSPCDVAADDEPEAAAGPDAETAGKIATLSEVFPGHDDAVYLYALNESGGSVEAAIGWLLSNK